MKLKEIIYQFQDHSNHTDISASYPLAIEWAKLVREKAEEAGEQPTQQEQEAFAEMMSELLGEMKENISISNANELSEQKQSEDMKESATANAITTKSKRKMRKLLVKYSQRVQVRGKQALAHN
jgi:translation initiation factor 2B subunit (eIF-2B alpha/beta/delta family)